METIVVGLVVGLIVGVVFFFLFPYFIPEVRRLEAAFNTEVELLEKELSAALNKIKELETKIASKL